MGHKLSLILKKRLLFLVSGSLAGGIAGYLYYFFYGCTNGCPLNSNPYLSIVWGMLVGYLLTDTIIDFYKKKAKPVEVSEDAEQGPDKRE